MSDTFVPIPESSPPKLQEIDRFFYETLRGDYPLVNTVTEEDYLFVSRFRDNMFKDNKIITVTDFQATLFANAVPNSRTITINGVAYDLSANRSWTIAGWVSSFNTRTGAVIPASWDYALADITGLSSALSAKQDTLVSGTNIKTINGSSILWSGNVTITGYSDEQAQDAIGAMIDTSLTYVDATPVLRVNEAYAHTWSTNQTFLRTSLWATTSPGVTLDNTTAATGTVLQASPSLLRRWRGFLSNSSTSYPFEIQDYAIGAIGLNPYGKWILQYRRNSGTWAEFLSFDSDPLGKGFCLSPAQAHSNGGPGTTRMMSLNNPGTNSWIDFLFSGVRKSHIGADSNGAMKFFAGGWSYFEYYQMSSSSMFSYNYPNAFYHSGAIQAGGHGQFWGKVWAGTGSGTVPTSTLTVNGGEAKKSRRVTSNTTLDDSAYFWIADATNPSCNGTPSVTNCATYTGSGQSVCESHLPCSWDPGTSCSGFNYESGMGTCIGTSGCSADTYACSGSDEYTCLANNSSYGGSCAWSGTDCSSFDESTCGSYSSSGCSLNYSDCSAFNGNDSACTGTSGCSSSGNTCPSQFDEWSCSGAGCSWDGMTCTWDNSTCSGTYFSGCTGTYYACLGNYYTGSCTGMYWASCNGTVLCIGHSTQTPCEAETGCVWVTAITITLPDSATLPNYSCAIYNGSSTGADVNIIAPAWHTTDISILSAYKDSVILQGFNDAWDCSVFTSAGACSPTGCYINYWTCSWNSGDNTCSGDASCTSIGDQMTCESTTYFSSCTGTWYNSKHYYRIAS